MTKDQLSEKEIIVTSNKVRDKFTDGNFLTYRERERLIRKKKFNEIFK